MSWRSLLRAIVGYRSNQTRSFKLLSQHFSLFHLALINQYNVYILCFVHVNVLCHSMNEWWTKLPNARSVENADFDWYKLTSKTNLTTLFNILSNECENHICFFQHIQSTVKIMSWKVERLHQKIIYTIIHNV